MAIFQKTVKSATKFSGVSLHSGKSTNMVIKPATENHGIVFKRVDLIDNNLIKVNFSAVTEARLCTILTNEAGAKVSTIEHLMAALWHCEIDNALIELDSDEVPILDGSAEHFIKEIKNVGISKLAATKKVLRILKEVTVRQDDKFITISPADDFSVHYTIDFKHDAIGVQTFSLSNEEDFGADISSARTFGLAKDLEMLQQMGLAKGASLANAIGLDEKGVMNPEGLRYRDEFVRHKILDCVGDLYLAGLNIVGKVTVFKGSHELHTQLLKEIYSDARNYRIEEMGVAWLISAPMNLSVNM
jgi:UDP-3-O-[3-hydroxymyristoyl] N-acetylglucosamine deacetylase